MQEHFVPSPLPIAIWNQWRQNLRRWGVTHYVTALLQTAGPLTTLAAQLIYLSEPFLGQGTKITQWRLLANLLEDSEQQRSFIRHVQEKSL